MSELFIPLSPFQPFSKQLVELTLQSTNAHICICSAAREEFVRPYLLLIVEKDPIRFVIEDMCIGPDEEKQIPPQHFLDVRLHHGRHMPIHLRCTLSKQGELCWTIQESRIYEWAHPNAEVRNLSKIVKTPSLEAAFDLIRFLPVLLSQAA